MITSCSERRKRQSQQVVWHFPPACPLDMADIQADRSYIEVVRTTRSAFNFDVENPAASFRTPLYPYLWGVLAYLSVRNAP